MIVRGQISGLVDSRDSQAGDESAWQLLLGCLVEGGIWDRFAWHGPFAADPSSLVPIETLDQVARQAADASGPAWGLWPQQEVGETLARAQVLPGGLSLQIGLASSDSIAADLERMTDTLESVLVLLGGQLRGQAAVYLKGSDDLPRARPPRRYVGLRPAAVVEWVDPTARPQPHTPTIEARQALATATLPRGAKRQPLRDALVRVDWGAVDSPDAIANTVAARQGWMADHLVGRIEKGFSDEGDQVHPLPRDTAAHAPLGAYSPRTASGYKKGVRRDGSVHEERLELASGWMAQGALPDGTPLRELWMVAVTREQALQLHPRALEAGATGVLWHQAETDTYWNPAPPGTWI